MDDGHRCPGAARGAGGDAELTLAQRVPLLAGPA